MSHFLKPFVLGWVLLAADARAADHEVVTVVAGAGAAGRAAGKPALVSPFGVDFDRHGTVFLVEMTGNRLRSLNHDGTLTVLAGTGEKGDGGDGAAGTTAKLNGPHSLAVGPTGEVFVADTWNNRVRRFDPTTGTIHPFAGTGKKGFSGDGGPAAAAEFGGVYCVALNPAGTRLYLADLDNRRVRVIELKTGVVTTVAGNGGRGAPVDGAEAVASPLTDPRAVAADRDGNVYVLERGGNCLRVVDPRGRIRTVFGAGTPKAAAPVSGSTAAARRSTLNGPKHLCIDRDGGVLIANTENHTILKYRPADGTVEVVLGTGKKGSALGAPAAVELDQPHGVTVGPDGSLYVSDSSNNRVLRVEREKAGGGR